MQSLFFRFFILVFIFFYFFKPASGRRVVLETTGLTGLFYDQRSELDDLTETLGKRLRVTVLSLDVTRTTLSNKKNLQLSFLLISHESFPRFHSILRPNSCNFLS